MSDEELAEITRQACEEANIAIAVDTLTEGITSISQEVSEAMAAGIHAGIAGLLKILQQRQLI